MPPSGTLHRAERRGSGAERVLERALATAAFVLVGGYAVGLVYLVLRGGFKIAALTLYSTPLSGVEHEDAIRFIMAACTFGAVAWGIASAVRSALTFLSVWRGRWDGFARAFVALAALVGAVALRDHLPRFLISLPSETQAGGGIGPEIFNTIYFAVLSTAVTLPIGVGAAVYLARFARAQGFVGGVRMALDTLASLPSIVYGLFGFLVFVVEMKAGYSLLAGAIVLALLNLPIVVGIAEESIRAVPRELDEASLALGATPVQTVFRVTLPYAWPGVLSAIVLSVGRVFAESAPLIMTAGTTISRSTAYSLNPLRGGETLAVHLWYVNSAGLAPDRADVSAGTAAILVVLVAAINMIASRFARLGGAEGTRAKKATR